MHVYTIAARQRTHHADDGGVADGVASSVHEEDGNIEPGDVVVLVFMFVFVVRL